MLRSAPFLAKRLAAGEIIGPGAGGFGGCCGDNTLASNFGGSEQPGEFRDGTTAQLGFIGFQLPGPRFGWIDVEVAPLNPSTERFKLTIKSFGYDLDGDPIAAGAVPEPASAAILLVGAVGILRRRMRPRRH